MNKDVLISKQQLELEIQKEINRENEKIISEIILKFVAIGQPLNDNVLNMNQKQLKWCQSVLDLVEQLKK